MNSLQFISESLSQLCYHPVFPFNKITINNFLSFFFHQSQIKSKVMQAGDHSTQHFLCPNQMPDISLSIKSINKILTRFIK